MQTAESHTPVFAPESSGYGLSERGFSDSGRTHQTDDRCMTRRGADQHGYLLEYALFHFFKTEMVGVEHLVCMSYVADRSVVLAPWQVGEKFEI